MSRDEIVTAGLVLSFALVVTTHVTLVVGLATRAPRWRAFVGLIVAPLAPYWGWKEGLRRRSVLWVAACAVYAVLRVVARR